MSHKNNFIGAAIIMVALFSSCAKLPIYESKNVNPPVPVDSKLKLADKEDSKKHLDYGVATDDANLYLQVCFHDQKNMSQMLSGGLNIYIDKTGKKKRDCVLSIENSPGMQAGPGKMKGSEHGETNRNNPPERGQQGMPEMQKSGEQGQGEMKESQDMNANVPMKVSRELNRITLTKDDEITFYSSLYDDKVVVKAEPYNFTQLMLTVKIPFSEIDVQRGEQLALGIETGKSSDSEENQQGSSPEEGGMSGGPGGSAGGGPGGSMGMGGGPGGGGPGGMQGGGMGGGMQSSSQSSGSPLKFWFLTQLK